MVFLSFFFFPFFFSSPPPLLSPHLSLFSPLPHLFPIPPENDALTLTLDSVQNLRSEINTKMSISPSQDESPERKKVGTPDSQDPEIGFLLFSIFFIYLSIYIFIYIFIIKMSLFDRFPPFSLFLLFLPIDPSSSLSIRYHKSQNRLRCIPRSPKNQ